jgi:hypothetical protein
MKEINGRYYPMWQGIIDKKQTFIGGIIQDFGDSMDRKIFGEGGVKTIITDITLEPNGEDSAYFSVNGKDFSCGGDVEHLGITAGEEGWLTFSGYGGHSWRICELLTPIKDTG